ncbi:MAG: hypothetical protein HQ530_03100 [Parcubacteria group bacterium]|nr:hypothetical protein [Parcubacteria group bacterium]
MAEVNNNISLSEREEHFTEYFRSLKLKNKKKNKLGLSSYLPARRWLKVWRRYRYNQLNEYKDIEAIAELVAGEETGSRPGCNIAKTITTANLEPDGGAMAMDEEFYYMQAQAQAEELRRNQGQRAQQARKVVAKSGKKLAKSSIKKGSQMGKALGKIGAKLLKQAFRWFIANVVLPVLGAAIGKTLLYAIPIAAILIFLISIYGEIEKWAKSIAEVAG